MTDDDINVALRTDLLVTVERLMDYHDADALEMSAALQAVASEIEVDAARNERTAADGGETSPDVAWEHFCRTGTILPGHADTIAERRGEQIGAGEDVTRVEGGDVVNTPDGLGNGGAGQ